MEYLAQHIESLIFTCEHPITFAEIKKALEGTFETKFDEKDLQETLEQLMEHFRTDTSSFEIVKIAGGYQFLTKGAFHATVGTYLKQTIKKRLSKAALETLAIVAYKQPVTKGDIENIRGVNCDYAMQKLLEKELVSITGRSDAPGRPLIYGTSHKFMDYFGIKDIHDLPKLKEFQEPSNSIGEAAPIEESIGTEDNHVHREDDIVDIAIAIADIYDPIPPREEVDQNLSDTEEEAGTPAETVEIAPNQEASAEVIPEAAEPAIEEEGEGINEFVTATMGEFTGETPEEGNEESEEESTEDQDNGNHNSPEDVVVDKTEI